MASKRTIEIFSAGCAICEALVREVRAAACPSCEITVLEMGSDGVAERAATLGVRSLPTVAIDGRLAECCSERGPDLDALKQAGLGRPLT